MGDEYPYTPYPCTVSLPIYRSTNLQCLPTHLSSVSIHPSIYLSIHRSIYLSVYLFVYHCLPISIPLQYLSISLSLFLSISIFFVKCVERDATTTHGALPTKLCKLKPLVSFLPLQLATSKQLGTPLHDMMAIMVFTIQMARHWTYPPYLLCKSP